MEEYVGLLIWVEVVGFRIMYFFLFFKRNLKKVMYVNIDMGIILKIVVMINSFGRY